MPSSTPSLSLSLQDLLGPQSASYRHVSNYVVMSFIEEGSYGHVFHARDSYTGDIVALKKLKLMKDKQEFMVAQREIKTLKMCYHPNIVNLREVVFGNDVNQVYLVMDFVEHDLRSLCNNMQEPFLQSETKTIMLQLASAMEYLHSNWILHRDLKTSNVLMNNRGQIKVADFGFARLTSNPPPPDLTNYVITLWYRPPELLLGARKYGPEVDMWSVGCIFAELLTREAIFPGASEVDQILRIFALLGVPTAASWPGYRRLPHAKVLTFRINSGTTGSELESEFPMLTNQGFDLLSRLLCLDPARRITGEEVLAHEYFKEEPMPKRGEKFPTFPRRPAKQWKGPPLDSLSGLSPLFF
ncbi:kinase-like protein [Terfezia boudieri ATCC MYA-4762]|uniref:cyclin-dependent kinase n=1 Tax=Terfezia boudieri ATCC MYA-4762 TaxID=1051890 RepID=A0A3N4L878_9PEZI|nr:kinase-like protein [Terfezia boudieri ATCC MYA-4762]